MASASIASIAPCEPIAGATVRDAVRAHERGVDFRIHWIAMGAAGLRPGDRLLVAPELSVLMDIAASLGFQKAADRKDATVIVVHRPTNNTLLAMVNRLGPGVRLIVYNEERDLDDMKERPFDIATACIFDQESKRVVLIYDQPCRVESYIDVELADISDSSISMHATRIATLR